LINEHIRTDFSSFYHDKENIGAIDRNPFPDYDEHGYLVTKTGLICYKCSDAIQKTDGSYDCHHCNELEECCGYCGKHLDINWSYGYNAKWIALDEHIYGIFRSCTNPNAWC